MGDDWEGKFDFLKDYCEVLYLPRTLDTVAERAYRDEDPYYIRMGAAWLFAEALCKQYESALPYIKSRRLSPWIHNKSIQKARESYRISEERKAELKSLK